MDENTFVEEKASVEEKNSSEEKHFTCNDCSKGFKQKCHLVRHRKFICHKAATLDHLEASKRRNQSEENLLGNVEVLESTSITYSEDSEMQEFISSHQSDYAKFRLCEDRRHPQTCPGFWPLLLDYRGKQAFSGVETSIGVKDAYKTLAAILSDGYSCYGIKSITFKKRAFVQLENNEIYDITSYRVPKTHCTVNPGAEVRLDQPKFVVVESDHEVTVSLHEKYIDLLPCFHISNLPTCQDQDDSVLEEHVEECDEDQHVELNMLYSDGESEEEDVFSQQFSQVSIEEDVTQSPAVKKMKLSLSKNEQLPVIEQQVDEPPQGKHRCPHCKVYVSGSSGQITRHIRNSCPENPDLDPLEAERRKKKLSKKLGVKQEIDRHIKCDIKIPDRCKSEKIDEDEDSEPTGWRGGDCGCRGADHQADCQRSSGVIVHALAHRRLPRNNQLPHLNPDPDLLHPHLLREILPVIQALNRKQFTNRQCRWMAGLGAPRNQLNIRNTHWTRVVSKHQLPFMYSDSEFTDLFYFNKQQLYQFRNAIVLPMLAQRAAQAQGVRGARNSLPHTLTPDSLTVLFMSKVRLNQKDREIAAQLGIGHRHVQKWLKILRDFYFTTDPYIQRNLDLGNVANLQAILQQGIAATTRSQRITGLYGHLQRPNTQLLVRGLYYFQKWSFL